MKSQQIDKLNIFLILLSLIVAFQIPFRLFLYAYAILGPLHYLTEISWIEERKFFVKERNWMWFVLLLGIGIALPYLRHLPLFEAWNDSVVIQYWARWSNGFIFIPFVMAIGLVITKERKYLWGFLAVGIVLAILLHQVSAYHLLIGTLLPTVIHVYLFTILFMLYGALKSKSRAGLVAVAVALIAPFFIAFSHITTEHYLFPDSIKNIFTENRFHHVNAVLGGLLGSSDGKSFFFYEEADVKIQIFIAFAYTYHYLNWFSKTSIIGWHKNLTSKRTALIVFIWLLSIALYTYDYRLGVIVLLFLSMLHVLFEFPINIISIRGIMAEMKGIVRSD